MQVLITSEIEEFFYFHERTEIFNKLNFTDTFQGIFQGWTKFSLRGIK